MHTKTRSKAALYLFYMKSNALCTNNEIKFNMSLFVCVLWRIVQPNERDEVLQKSTIVKTFKFNAFGWRNNECNDSCPKCKAMCLCLRLHACAYYFINKWLVRTPATLKPIFIGVNLNFRKRFQASSNFCGYFWCFEFSTLIHLVLLLVYRVVFVLIVPIFISAARRHKILRACIITLINAHMCIKNKSRLYSLHASYVIFETVGLSFNDQNAMWILILLIHRYHHPYTQMQRDTEREHFSFHRDFMVIDFHI